MSTLMLFIPMLLLLLGPSLSFAREDKKNNSRPLPSKIQYAGEDGDQQENNGIYGSSPDSYIPYGGLSNGYGGFIGPQEVLRNRFPGSDSNSQDQNQDSGQSTGGSSYGYPNSGEGNEEPNGVFNNPFLGQGRRTFSVPIVPSYGGTSGGDETGYGGGAYPGGRFTPSYGLQPSIYSSPSGFRPGTGQGFIYPSDQGYVYPFVRVGGSGVGLRRPNYPYGYGIGNGYGVYPGTLRYVPVGILPSSEGSGIYGGSPRGYGPTLYGYGQYPEMTYPGMGFEYGRLNGSNPGGDNSDGASQGARLPYPQSLSSSQQSNETSQGKTNSLRKEDP